MEAFIQNVSAKYKENNEFIVHFCIMYFVSKIQNVVDSNKSQKVLDFKKVLITSDIIAVKKKHTPGSKNISTSTIPNEMIHMHALKVYFLTTE